jgi:hypothetical protein
MFSLSCPNSIDFIVNIIEVIVNRTLAELKFDSKKL